MEDDGASIDRSPDRLLVAKIRLDEPNAGDGREVLELAVREVIQSDDLLPVRDEPAAEVGTDETGGTGHERAHVWAAAYPDASVRLLLQPP